MPGPHSSNLSGEIALPVTITIADPWRAHDKGMSRLKTVAVLPANGWSEASPGRNAPPSTSGIAGAAKYALSPE